MKNHSDQIKFSIENHVALLKLNKPEVKNAYSIELSRLLSEALQECDKNDEVRAVVITGEGDNFCVGLDLKELKTFKESGDPIATNVGHRTYPCDINKPVICAINGLAAGFGAAYPMSCDIRLVGENTLVSFSFVRVGLVSELAATWTLPRIVGIERAMELLFTGRKLVGQEIVDAGLASRVVDDASLLDEALDLAYKIAQNSAPVCVAHTKRTVWDRLYEPINLRQAIIEDRDHISWAFSLPDCTEGTMAFVEKRQALWKDSVSRYMKDRKGPNK